MGRARSYLPIENYGIIVDLHTAALVGIKGSIDWLCFPYFDSPSVFAGILDAPGVGPKYQPRMALTPYYSGIMKKWEK